MARNHLRFSVDAWRDPDWLALSIDAQWLFVAILSQPKMTLVGSIDINPLRWAGLSPMASTGRVQDALDELEDGRFVVTDRNTGELVVRSFTKNDLAPSRLSPQIAKGFWAAWKGLASPALRRVVVDNCPDDIWEKLERHAPDDALHNRRSAPIDREPPPPNDSEDDSQSIPPIDNPATRNHLPETSSQQPSDAAAADPESVFSDTVDLLVRRTMQERPPKSNPGGYEAALRRGKWSDHYERAMRLLADVPEVSAHDLALVLEPPVEPALRLVSRERCQTCNDTTWLDAEVNDDGTWGAPKPCPDCNEAASA